MMSLPKLKQLQIRLRYKLKTSAVRCWCLAVDHNNIQRQLQVTLNNEKIVETLVASSKQSR